MAEWLKSDEGKQAIKAMGSEAMLRGLSDEAKFGLVWGDQKMRNEALSALEDENQNYGGYREQLGRRADLVIDLKKDQVPVETQLLLVNVSQKIIQRLEKEKDALRDSKADQSLIDAKDKEIEMLLNTQTEIIQRINGGQSLGKKAEEQLEVEGNSGIVITKAEYVQAIIDANNPHFKDQVLRYPAEKAGELNASYDEIIKNGHLSEKRTKELQAHGNLLVGKPRTTSLSKEEVAMAMSMGYNVDDISGRGWLPWGSKKIKTGGHVVAENWEDFTKKLAVKWSEHIKGIVSKDMTTMAEENYDAINTARDKRKQEIIKGQIEFYARSSQRAEGGVAGVYERIKKRLMTEYGEGLAKKEITPQESKIIHKTFAGTGKREVSLNKLVGEIYHGEAKDFADLNDNPEHDSGIISGFLGGYGVRVSPEKLAGVLSSERYKKARKQPKGFVKYLISLIIQQPWQVKKAKAA